jgi:hypothetical protein
MSDIDIESIKVDLDGCVNREDVRELAEDVLTGTYDIGGEL